MNREILMKTNTKTNKTNTHTHTHTHTHNRLKSAEYSFVRKQSTTELPKPIPKKTERTLEDNYEILGTLGE